MAEKRVRRGLWLYIVVRYWREITTGWKRGWHRSKTYRVRWQVHTVMYRETDDQPWRPLDATYTDHTLT